MWKNLYNWLLEMVTNPWAYFVTKHSAQGRLVKDIFFASIYQYAGFILLTVSVVSCMLYYFYFNRRFGRYYTRRWWVLWMFSTSFLIGFSTFLVANSMLSAFLIPTMPLVLWLSLINAFYGIILFFFVSLICQGIAILGRRIFSFDLSPMASRTPF